MSKAELIAAVLWIALTLYALLAGADFGAGLWDLLAGDERRGARPRDLIHRVLTPVWEANHVWLIFMLVVTWTAFPDVFAAIASTLFVPLALAALGIVMRGSGFAFRGVVGTMGRRRLMGATFALSSVITPFFMGTVAGAIATGRVPAEGNGDRLTSWLNLPSVTIGLLLVANCAYLAAVYLVNDARSEDDADMERYFRARAIAAGVVAGGLAAAALAVMRDDARALFDDLTGAGLPLVAASAALGAATIVQLARDGRFTRWLAIGAVTAIVWGWGVAQHPDALYGQLTLDQAAAPSSTLSALLAVLAAAALVVGPALALLLRLQQRGRLGGEHRS